jgi:hypothetical protein
MSVGDDVSFFFVGAGEEVDVGAGSVVGEGDDRLEYPGWEGTGFWGYQMSISRISSCSHGLSASMIPWT